MRLLALFWILRRNLRLLSLLALLSLASVLALVFHAKHQIERVSAGKVAAQADGLAPHKVALVLGCAKTLANGRANLYFKHRITAAHELYRQGTVDYLLVSGDNSRSDYDESTDMKDALIALGVPAERIVCDYAGFSTLDSVVRAKEVFQLDAFIVVSQEFHVRRAIYIAEKHGLDVAGYAAQEVSGAGGIRTNARELLARVKTLLDVHLLGREPKFLGDAIAIGELS